MAQDENKPLTTKQFNGFINDLVEHLNKVHSQTCRRLDDIDQSLQKIEIRITNVEQKIGVVESNISSVKRDTKSIPDIFDIPHIDGDDIAKLTTRVNKLEN